MRSGLAASMAAICGPTSTPPGEIAWVVTTLAFGAYFGRSASRSWMLSESSWRPSSSTAMRVKPSLWIHLAVATASSGMEAPIPKSYG